MRRIRLLAAISTGLALTAAAVAPASARPAGPPTTETAPRAAAASTGNPATVRLITGDRVTVSRESDGRQLAAVEPGTGRKGIVFRTVEQDGHLTVLPSDAAPLVAAGRLDRTLFDVTALLAQHHDEAHTDALPLIVGRTGDASAKEVTALTALADDNSPVRTLGSINARAVRVAPQDLGRFWKELAPASGQFKASELSATPRVWLDGRVNASLDRSTAQIGAPDVWAKGYRGEGVKVAVLDTGVDRTHPDLAGRIAEAKDFSGSGTGTSDVFGHGTHVASIVGGTGAASEGSRKGVAPAAELLVGKVLGDDGYGYESQIIAGMEWAADQDAEVVSMSLGSDVPSDGTDPMSQAVNELSHSSGALFVVAAGNSGEQGTSTVGSPGAADAALTVGAVDRDDSLAPFSSRGPRFGDDAVKPDVTAPGVGIVAARATGVTVGDPVDDHYTAASGTSMATPHVAGAAALLAQQHPDWSGEQIKDALVSTARTVAGQQVTEQGGGRIDLPAAAFGPVTATGSVTLGSFAAGAPARTSTLTYSNSSDTDVTLTLRAHLATAGGKAAPADAVQLGADSVRVPAGGTAEVPLTVDPAKAERGKYYGYVTGTDAAGTVSVHTTLSLIVHAPVHRLTVKSYDKDGNQVPSLPNIWGADGFVGYTDTDAGVAEVEEGTYQLDEMFMDTASDGQEIRQVVLPEVKVTKDMTVTLDARDTRQVEIRTPRPAEQRGILSYQTYREIDGQSMLQGVMYFDLAKRLYVSPTSKVHDGTFEFVSRWQLVAPLLDMSSPDGKLDAYYMSASPLLDDGTQSLTAVDAGDAGAPDFTRARGKVAVLTNEQNVLEDPVMTQAAAAGVRAVVLVHFDDIPWTRWHPEFKPRWAVPAIRIGKSTGAALLDRIHDRTTSLTVRTTSHSPYLYDVEQVSKQQIPQQVTYTVTRQNSAVVNATYADNGGIGWESEQRFAWRPSQQTAWLQYTRHVPTGFERTEYVSAGDTTWQHLVHHTTTSDIDLPLVNGMRDEPRTYRAGAKERETWQGAVVRPSIPAGTANPTVRAGDVLRLRIPEFTDSQAGHWSRLTVGGGFGGFRQASDAAGDSAKATLYRDGTRLADLDSAWTDAQVPSADANYRLDMTTSRNDPAWVYGTHTDTSWSFRSGRTDKATALPLLQLDYALPVDAHNTIGSAGPYGLDVTVRTQQGLPAPSGVHVGVETSYDDGKTWHAASVRDRDGDSFRATVQGLPKGTSGAYVTLRVTAEDGSGNSVRQTVRRAYLQGS